MSTHRTDPPIVSIDGGIIHIEDTEPLDSPPDASWAHTITVHLVISKSDTPGTYLVRANGSSESSDRFTNLAFDMDTKTLAVELNTLNTSGVMQNFEQGGYSFTPEPGDEEVTISISKNGRELGRSGKHTIAYLNVKEPEQSH